MTGSTARAPSSRSRILAIDAARGLALIGMVIVNVGPREPDSIWHRLWLAPYGRASVLFVLVAGIAMTYLFRSSRSQRPWVIIAWRSLLLMLGGLALGLLPHDVNVILPIYGVLFAVSIILRLLPSPALVAVGLAFAILGPIWFITEGFHHVGDPPGVLTLEERPGDLVHSLFLTRPYPLVVWIVPFVAGMLLGRIDLNNRHVQGRIILGGAVAAVVGFVVPEMVAAFAGDIDSGYALLLTGAAHGQMPLWLISAIGSGALTVALLARYWDRLAHRLGFLVDTGQMALTLYVAHLLILAVVRPSGGFDFLGGALTSVLMVVAFCVLAVVWRRRFGVGPFERVLRGGWLARAAGAGTSTAPPQSRGVS